MHLLFLLLFFTPHGPPKVYHAIYIGMVEVHQRGGDGSALVNIKVFQDDLQSCVRDAYPEAYVPGVGERWLRANAALVERYFKKHLRCRIAAKDVHLLFQTGEVLEEVYLLQFSMACPSNWQDILIRADFFMELFPTQSNVIQVVHADGVRRFGRTTPAQPFVSFSF